MTRSPTHSLLDLDGRRHTDPPQLWAGVVGGSIALHVLLLVVAIPLTARLSSVVSGSETEEPIPIEMIDLATAPSTENPSAAATHSDPTAATEAQPFQASSPSSSETTPPPSSTQPTTPSDIPPQAITQAPIATTNPIPPSVPDRQDSGTASGATEPETPTNPAREPDTPSDRPASDNPPDNPSDNPPPQSPPPTETATRPVNPVPPAAPPDSSSSGEGTGSEPSGSSDDSALPDPANNPPPAPPSDLGSELDDGAEVAVSEQPVPGSYIASVSVAPVPASEAQDVPNQLPIPTASSLQFTYDPAAPESDELSACVVDPESIRFLGSSVAIQVVVDANGEVTQTFIRPESQALGESYRSLAQCLVDRWTFSPALNFVEGSPEGIPVATDQVIVTVTIDRE